MARRCLPSSEAIRLRRFRRTAELCPLPQPWNPSLKRRDELEKLSAIQLTDLQSNMFGKLEAQKPFKSPNRQNVAKS